MFYVTVVYNTGDASTFRLASMERAREIYDTIIISENVIYAIYGETGMCPQERYSDDY